MSTSNSWTLKTFYLCGGRTKVDGCYLGKESTKPYTDKPSSFFFIAMSRKGKIIPSKDCTNLNIQDAIAL
jgi:hypothetical protein